MAGTAYGMSKGGTRVPAQEAAPWDGLRPYIAETEARATLIRADASKVNGDIDVVQREPHAQRWTIPLVLLLGAVAALVAWLGVA